MVKKWSYKEACKARHPKLSKTHPIWIYCPFCGQTMKHKKGNV